MRQRTMNICPGSALATIGLTVPAVLPAAWIVDLPIRLGPPPAHVVMRSLSLAIGNATFGGLGRTLCMERAVSPSSAARVILTVDDDF